MPCQNRFRHCLYDAQCSETDLHIVDARRPPAVGSVDYVQRMSRVAEAFRGSRVAAIYLVHGTFLGGDALGFFCELSRLFPEFASRLQTVQKSLVDALAGDTANFSSQFARHLQQALGNEEGAPVVKLFNWCSQNHHLGRADAAIRLLDDLNSLDLPAGSRVLVWGHSHGGNVLALLSNLLASDVETRRHFFHAARTFYHRPLPRKVDIPVWHRVAASLEQPGSPLPDVALDFVTFGTPVLYGWDTDGCSRLMHVVYHRPTTGLRPYQARFPLVLDDLLSAAQGDCIQQLGIAGTNLPPNVFSWRAWVAERRLTALLQQGIRRRDLWTNLQAGRRVPDDGIRLLVDYGPAHGNVAQHIAGHGIYTRSDWLLFHAEQVAQHFYRLPQKALW